MPHAAFLHERFLFRFGHDRTMLLHGRDLVRRGWRVSFVGFDMDREVVEALGAQALVLPPGPEVYADLDRHACERLKADWFSLFPEGTPDVVVNGGWPFYAFNAEAESLGAAAVVFDAGATPLEGVPAADLPVHAKLRALRGAHMPAARRTISVSEFIASSQTRQDAPAVPNVVVRNGVDHIVDPLWSGASEADAQGVLTSARAGGRRALLHLGRWEGGYKNRDGALEVLRRVRSEHDVSLIVLADRDDSLPSDLRPHVVFAGHPSDSGLRVLMAGADAGFSASVWEGFNLPLAEMLYLGGRAFALDTGAHSEVVSHPTYVRPTLQALADGVIEALSEGTGSAAETDLATYRTEFAWTRAAAELEAVLRDAIRDKRRETAPRYLALDVTNASRDPANSGVVRVTRRLAAALQPLHRLLFLAWDEAQGGYRTLRRDERTVLSSYGGPQPRASDADESRALGAVLSDERIGMADLAWLCPETVLQPRADAVADWFAREEVAPTALLHDLIPLTHPHGCSADIVAAFPAYRRLLEQASVLIANSETTAEAWRRLDVDGPDLVVERLPGDVLERGAPKPEAAPDVVRVLVVSTFEPRKNHAGLLSSWSRACELAAPRRLELHLVGGGYSGDGGVAAQVRAAAENDASIHVHGLVSDDELDRLYEACDFTVYPSLWEGFGLPLAESVHRARPFICSRDGAMAEIAACGAGLAGDVSDPEALGAAIARLATDDALRARLSRVAALTPVRTWRDYARACLAQALSGRPSAATRRPTTRQKAPEAPRQITFDGHDMDWDSLLYPGKPHGVWQMSDSERMALTGLLARRRPRNYLEIGTYHGGSALLASEFADWVVTIDIDPEAETRFEKPDNVTFVAGRSQEVLPDLLQDLLERDLYPDFVLIDGDHSAEGVRRDIEIFLRIRPPRPLVIVFHDSFNPVCRSGIRTAPWADCPYVAKLDIDFVPGRLVDIAGDPFSGQMWGGLAVAVLTPEPQPHPFLTATSEHLFQRTLSQAVRQAA